MIKIAVLDDDKEYFDKIYSIVEPVMCQLDLEYEMKNYNDVEEFLQDLREEIYYDIYLLDVEMPRMNGLEVARNIRFKFNEAIIIYITNYVDYAIEAFEVNAYRYIPKRCIEEKLPEAFDVLLSKRHQRQEKVYVIKTMNSLERIAYKDIYYLKKEGKYVRLVHKRGTNRVRITLEEALKTLNSDEFFLIDRNCAVNLKHVISLKDCQLRLNEGIILSISKPRVQQVINEIIKIHEVR